MRSKKTNILVSKLLYVLNSLILWRIHCDSKAARNSLEKEVIQVVKGTVGWERL